MSTKTLPLYKFDDFCLDTNQKCLLHADKMVSLTPKAYQTLLVLIKNRNQVVEKEFLLNEVWADTFVEETTLSQNILTLRKTLGAFQKGKDFIVTFPRRGYKFVVDVEEVVNDEEVFILEKRTRTHIVAEQRIHDSLESNEQSDAIEVRQNATKPGFVSAKNVAVALLCVLFLAIGSFSTWYFMQANGFAESASQKPKFNTLVSDANIKNAVTSPNGKYLAFLRLKEGMQSLSIRQIENGNTIEIAPKFYGTLIGLTFSPDSEQIYYSVYESSELNQAKIGTLYRVPVFGGASQKILSGIDSLPSISPDKTKIAFMRRNSESLESAIIISDIDGKSERNLAVRASSEGFTNFGASWSPDGKLLSASVNQTQDEKKTVQVAIINPESGEQKIITNEDWNWAGQTLWLKDGKGIVVPAYRETSPTLNDELWLVSYPDGKARYLANGIKGDLGISLNNETNGIVALKTDKLTCFLSASLDNFRKSNLISTRVGDLCLLPIGADWTVEGKIVYSTTEGGNADIWTIDEDGGGKRQLTSDKSAEVSPTISKDGRYLIFLSNRSGKMSIWRSHSDGTNPIQLTENKHVTEAIISPDSDTVFYLAKNSVGFETLWKVSINGENDSQITQKTTRSPRISPDGKTIAAYFPDAENKMSLTLLSSENGDVIKHLETPPHDNIPFLDWAKNGQDLFVILQKEKPFCLWKIGINDAKAEKMREWENDAIFRFVISKDGERAFYEVGTEVNGVVQLEGDFTANY